MTGPIVGVEMPEAGMGMRTGFRRETHEAQSFLVVCDEPGYGFGTLLEVTLPKLSRLCLGQGRDWSLDRLDQMDPEVSPSLCHPVILWSLPSFPCPASRR